MARVKGKGSIFKVTISSVLTAVPGIISISSDGEESETEEIRVIDGAAGIEMDPTGFTKPCTVTIEYYYDPANSVHAFIKTTLRTPANLPNAMTKTYTDAGPVTETYSCTGISYSEKIESASRVKATAKFQMSGLAT